MKFKEAIKKILSQLGLEEKTLREIEFQEDYLYPEYLRGSREDEGT